MMHATGKVTRQKAEASVVEGPTAPMVDTSESVQYKVFLSNFPRLVEAVRPVVVKFAVNALSKSLISEYNKCQAENPTKEEYDRASVLMSQILPKIKESDAHFDAFVGILEELKITKLDRELKKAVDPRVPTVLTANRTRGDFDSKSTSGTESVDATGFQCPCRHCSLEKYFRDRSKCPGLQKTSFPYLDISHLSRVERKTLEHQLIADTNRIKKEFKKLSDAVFKALKGTKTHISEIRGTVFSSAKAGSSKTIQTLHGDKLETITTISDLKSFLIRHDYISFFNYGILEALIEEYDECKKCQTDLDSYLQKFEDFSRRNVFEVPSDVFASSSSLDNLLVVKVIDEKWFGADRDASNCPFTMWDITSIQNKIVEVIGPGHDRSFIDLVDVGKGCLQLAFEILSCQDTPIFPLTTSQLSELIRCGIIVLYQPINMQDTDYQTHDIQSTAAEDTKTPPTVPSADDSETPPIIPPSLLEGIKNLNFHPNELKSILTKSGEDVNALEDDSEGYGAIHYIAEGRHRYTTGLLVVLTIYGRANLDLTTNKGGKTALHIAVERENLQCVKTLVALGANVNTVDLLGKTPYDTAKLETKVQRFENEVQLQQFDHSSTIVRMGSADRKRGLEETVELSGSYSITTATVAKNVSEEDSKILKALESVGGKVGKLKTPVEKTPPNKRPARQLHVATTPTTSEMSILGTPFPSPPIGFVPVPLNMHVINCAHYKELECEVNTRLRDENYHPTPEQALELVKKLQQYTSYQSRLGSRILCLDGGGIRGLLQMTILQEIERRTGKRITELFDWIVGTSTGGVIALAICYGPPPTGRKTVRQLRDIYWIAKDDVFKESSGDGLFNFSKGDSKNLEDFLQDWLGKDVRMDRDPHELKSYLIPKVLIPAVHRKDGVKLHFFNNCFNNERSNELVWKVARSTSAAPFFFTEFENYIDGGVLANNPSEDALTVIQEFYRERGEKLPISMLVSIGSGINPPKPAEGKIDVQTNVLNLIAWKNFAGVVEQAMLNQSAHSNCQSRCKEQGISYFRFNPVLDETVDSGQKDTKKLLNMLWKTRTYLNQPDVCKEMDKLEKLLSDSALATTPDPLL